MVLATQLVGTAGQQTPAEEVNDDDDEEWKKIFIETVQEGTRGLTAKVMAMTIGMFMMMKLIEFAVGWAVTRWRQLASAKAIEIRPETADAGTQTEEQIPADTMMMGSKRAMVSEEMELPSIDDLKVVYVKFAERNGLSKKFLEDIDFRKQSDKREALRRFRAVRGLGHG